MTATITSRPATNANTSDGLLDDLVAAVDSELRRTHAPDGSCILAAALVTEVLDCLGIDSDIVPTSVLVVGPSGKAAFLRGYSPLELELAGHYVVGCGIRRQDTTPSAATTTATCSSTPATRTST